MIEESGACIFLTRLQERDSENVERCVGRPRIILLFLFGQKYIAEKVLDFPSLPRLLTMPPEEEKPAISIKELGLARQGASVSGVPRAALDAITR